MLSSLPTKQTRSQIEKAILEIIGKEQNPLEPLPEPWALIILTLCSPPSSGLDDAAAVLALFVAQPGDHGGHE